MYRQYKLKLDEKEIVCWLQDDPNVRVGSKISIKKGDGQFWTCIERYTVLVKDKPLMDWNNNI